MKSAARRRLCVAASFPRRPLMTTGLVLLLVATAGLQAEAKAAQGPSSVHLTQAGLYTDGRLAAAEIVAHDPRSEQLFVVNGFTNEIDVLDFSDPAHPTLTATIALAAYGSGVQSVAVHAKSPDRSLVAAAVASHDRATPGSVVLFTTAGEHVATYTAGFLPDMLTFTHDGERILVANEAEPYCVGSTFVDPYGSITIIDLRDGTVADLRFADLPAGTIDAAMRTFGPSAGLPQDIEPEYITVAKDDRTAFVSLQENNAIAILDLDAPAIVSVRSLGLKDHSLPQNAFDASERDGRIRIQDWPVQGMYMPDSLAAYEAHGETFVVSANEGDARDYPCYSEERRVRDITLDPTAFPNRATLRDNANLGRLKTTTGGTDLDADGDFDRILSYGARSFSIWNAQGEQVFDSGADFERVVAEQHPAWFNANHEANDASTFDSRSDDKGPEPEALALGRIASRTYAFVGLERMGGIMVYDVTNPEAPSFVEYVNDREFGAPMAQAGELGPEGMVFIAANDNSLKVPLLVVANEISGSTSIYRVDSVLPSQ